MKKLTLVLASLLISVVSLSQTPQSFKYQAVARDVNGNVITDQAVGMKISILQGSTSGTEMYVETFTTTTTGFGLINLNIGAGTVVSGDFTTIDWSSDIYFIKVEMDITGGTSYEEFGTSQLLSVPYALHAETTTNVDDADADPNNELQDLSSVLGEGADANNNNITNLAEPVSDQDAATKAYVDILLEKIEHLESLVGVEDPVTDIEGNSYQTFRIGTQVWMTENLKTTKYNDGTDIPLVTDDTDWSNLATPGYCWYDNNEATYGDTYGALYNWYTIGTGNLCPAGWHVPTDAEWTTLTDYLGGESVAGGKMKEIGTTHWNSPNTGATNETGFTALPGGIRDYDGTFYNIADFGYWWSSTESSTTFAWYRYLHYDYSDVYKVADIKKIGLTVRCVRN